MIGIILLCLLFLPPLCARAQTDSIFVPESQSIDLQLLVVEAMMKNPEIQASVAQMDVMDAKGHQVNALPDPELRYMQENMPDFRFHEAMFSRLELSQMVPFPAKLFMRGDLAQIRAEHAHHDHLEKVNEIIAKVKAAYYDLWFAQQNIVLDRENARLVTQFLKIAGTRYSLGSVPQQDVLKARVEFLMIYNELISLRQRELSDKAMLIITIITATKVSKRMNLTRMRIMTVKAKAKTKPM